MKMMLVVDEKTNMQTEYDVSKIREDFPVLHQKINQHPLVYLDNAATTQKPLAVIEALDYFYRHDNSNVHRGIHTLSERATEAYEQARESVRQFINAKHSKEIIFLRGTTEAINLVAQSYGRTRLQAGDEIIISAMEHHSNIVPWQLLAEQVGCVLKVIPVNDAGELDLTAYEQLLNARTKLVAVSHMSNVLGTINPVTEMIRVAHAQNIPVLLDGAQSIAHLPIDVQALDCDFFVFSGHKVYAPTGIGVLYAKQDLLRAMPPYQGGGGMIHMVSFGKSLYADVPEKFEAGTPNIAGAIGLASALDYVAKQGIELIAQYEHALTEYATQALRSVPGLRLIGTAACKAAVFSFVMQQAHPHDIGTILNSQGVAVRSGHHCCMPLMERFQVPATVRASLAMYNTRQEIDALVQALHKVGEIFS
jgi:cysteine desulfurase/selenocysteine lyase